LANGASDSENEEEKTLKEEKMDADDPGSGAGRITRGESRFTSVVTAPLTQYSSLRSPPATVAESVLSARHILHKTSPTLIRPPSITTAINDGHRPHRLQLLRRNSDI